MAGGAARWGETVAEDRISAAGSDNASQLPWNTPRRPGIWPIYQAKNVIDAQELIMSDKWHIPTAFSGRSYSDPRDD